MYAPGTPSSSRLVPLAPFSAEYAPLLRPLIVAYKGVYTSTVWLRPLILGLSFRSRTSWLMKRWVETELTFFPETTTSKVLFGTVFANCAEMMLEACTDSSCVPDAEPCWRDVTLPSCRIKGTRVIRVSIQRMTRILLRRYTRRPIRLKTEEPLVFELGTNKQFAPVT